MVNWQILSVVGLFLVVGVLVLASLSAAWCARQVLRRHRTIVLPRRPTVVRPSDARARLDDGGPWSEVSEAQTALWQAQADGHDTCDECVTVDPARCEFGHCLTCHGQCPEGHCQQCDECEQGHCVACYGECRECGCCRACAARWGRCQCVPE